MADKKNKGLDTSWLPDELKIFSEMETLAHIGWCMADHDDQMLYFSDYLTKVFRRDTNFYPFPEFIAQMHPEYSYRLDDGVARWAFGEVYDQVYPVLIGSEYVWFHAKFSIPHTDSRGHSISYGTLQILESRDYEQYTNEVYKVQLSDLLQSQKYVSDLLLKLLQESNIDKIIQDILYNIIEKFDADRAYIFSFDYAKQTHSCVYEVNKDGISAEIDELQDIPIEETKWWCTQMIEDKTVIIEDLETIRDEHPVEYQTLHAQDINSLMVVPLTSSNGVWGYIGVDIVGKKRTWYSSEQEWFQTVSNYISVCLELHRALSAAQRSGETMRGVYRELPIGVGLYDANGDIEEINDVTLKIFGIENRNNLSGNIFDHPLLTPAQIEGLRRGEGLTADISHTFTDKTRAFYGSKFIGHKDLSIKCTILYGEGGRIEHYLMMIIDNTALLEAHRKAHESQVRFDAISEFAEVGIYRMDLTTRKFFANKQWYKNMSLTPPEDGDDEIYADKYFSVLAPEDAQEFKDYVERFKNGELKHFKQMIKVRDGEGWRYLSCVNMVAEDENGSGHFVIAGLNDNITESKLAEFKLIEAKARAEESDRLKSAFLANMSHEIRTPLNAIVGFSSILAEADDPAERDKFVEIIQRNNEQLLQLIADILDLSKIEAGVIDVSYGDVEINTLCAEVVGTMAVKAPEGVTMKFVSKGTPVHINTDRNRLTQVLSNFLGNAVKFTREGTITLGYVADGKWVEFSVKDTGIGMSSEETNTVFERFVKFNDFVSGTGLGLSICKVIAEKLGGSVGVDSEQGKGSRFWIRLPYLDVPA